MATPIIKNDYLSMAEMTINAQIIMDYFIDKGWSKQAISGMLGNMQSESSINSGIWESLNEGNMDGGFGLVQWTPASKYTSWADSKGYSWTNITGQMERIIYEVENGLQWISTTSHPMTFEEFTKSTDTPYNLAMVFIANYERPLEPNQPIRGTQAEYWYTTLTGEGGGGTPTDPTGGDYKLLKKYIYGQDNNLFGRRFFSKTNSATLIKRVGNMAIIKVDNKKYTVPFKNLKKLSI